MSTPPLPPEIAAQYPFASRHVRLRSGERMHYVDEGEGDPVVLLHGNPTWSFLWRNFIPPLTRAGFRAIAPDHVGFGLSDKPRGQDGRPPSPPDHVENLTAFLRELDVRDITLVVHDWGGPIGLAWAGRHPDLVKRLVILNTAAWAPRRKRPMSPWHALFASPLAGPLAVTGNLLVESAMRFGVHHRARMRGDLLHAYRWPMRDRNARRAAVEFVRSVPDGPDHLMAPFIRDVEHGLDALAEKPALVLWGDADPIFGRKLADRWQQALPGVQRVRRYSDGGHFLQEDVPERLVADLLRFLRDTPGKTA